MKISIAVSLPSGIPLVYKEFIKPLKKVPST